MADVDDDFGELYADVEVQAKSVINGISFRECRINQNINDDSSINSPFSIGPPPANEEYSKNEQSSCRTDSSDDDDELGRDKNFEMGDEEAGEKEEAINKSDSDNDFDIVLNDGDEDGGSVRGAGCGWKNAGGVDGNGLFSGKFKEVEAVVAAAKEDDYGGGSELVSRNYLSEKMVGGKGDGSLRYKNVSAFPSNPRRAYGDTSGCMQNGRSSLNSGSISLIEDITGYVFSLPWYRNILDMDLDTFEQKPWRNPNADVTDFFNFGFNEESWKKYCQSLLNHQAIQVENGSGERQPTMDVRRPHDRDSDVIEIIVQDSKECSSSSFKDEVSDKVPIDHKVLETCCFDGEPMVPGGASAGGTSQNIPVGKVRSPKKSFDTNSHDTSATTSSHTFSSSDIQENKQSLCSDPLHPVASTATSAGKSREVKKQSTLVSDAGKHTSELDPCLMELGLSLEDHNQLSASSPSVKCCSEASKEDNTYDPRENPNSVPRSSSSSHAKQVQWIESDCSYYRLHERENIIFRASNSRYSSRDKSSIQEGKYHNRRLHQSKELKRTNDDDPAYCKSRSKHMHNVDHPRAYHRKRNRRLPSSATYKDLPPYDKKEYLYVAADKMSFRDRIQAVYSPGSHRHGHGNTNDDMNPSDMKEWEEKDFFDQRRNQQLEDHIVDRDLYRQERVFLHSGSAFAQNLHRYMESGRCSPWRKEYDDIELEGRIKNDLLLESRFTDGFCTDKLPRPDLYHDDKINHSFSKYERCLSHTRREGEIYVKRDSFFHSQPQDLDHLPSARGEYANIDWEKPFSMHQLRERYPGHTDKRHDLLPQIDDINDFRLMESHERHSRHVFTDGSKDGYICRSDDWHRTPELMSYCDEDLYIGKRHEVYEDEMKVCKLLDDLCEDNITFDDFNRCKMYNGKPMRFQYQMQNGKRIAKHGSKVTRSSVSSYHGTSAKVLNCGKHEQTGLKFRGSVGLHSAVREQKSYGACLRAENVTPTGYHESVARKHQKRWKDRLGEGYAYKGVMPETQKGEASSGNLESLFIKQHNDQNCSDLEEGQIPTEKNSDKAIGKKCTAGMLSNDRQKGLRFQYPNFNCENRAITGFQNRILETMAKMEKRKMRFKESTPVRKESKPRALKMEVKTPVEADQKKQQRPIRKRKWVGS